MFFSTAETCTKIILLCPATEMPCNGHVEVTAMV